MVSLPTVPFGPVEVTRLIVGGNPLCGNSHLDEATSREMAAYHTAENVVATLQACEAAGINAVQARGDYHRVLHWIELFRRQGGRLHWIAQTASEMHDVHQNIRILAAAGAVGIYHHGSRTDRLWKAGRIDAVEDCLKSMRDTGVQVGLGSHIPEVFEHADERGWDVDFYMTCLYNLSREERESALVSGDRGAAAKERFLEEDPPRMMQVIQGTDKTCLAFKILAASRQCGSQEEVAAAFRYAFTRIKAQDAVVVGMYQKHLDQVSLNVGHARAALGMAPSSDAAGSGR
ncbi:MAG: hypothetical protein ABIL09_18975 [Gemmatimonadota bacterium]